MLENDQGMTALHIAAETSQARVVEHLIIDSKCSVTAQIEALELLGSSYANNKDNYDIAKCYAYLLLAMRQRYRDPNNIVKKEIKPPIPAYRNHIECKTIEELEAIRNNHNALHFESLVIRERILGENNVEIPHAIIFRGAVFADSARFDCCVALWMRAMELRRRNNRPVAKDILRFTQVFSQMLHVGAELDIPAVETVFQHLIDDELHRDEQRLIAAETKEEKEMTMERLELNMHTALYLLVILTKVKCNKEEEFHVCKLTYQLNKLCLKLKSKNCYTLLHMACDEETRVDDFHVNDIVQFPNDLLAKHLVRCGADVNAVDSLGNLPLHTIVRYNKPISDFLTLHNIIISLIEGGTHLDQTNNKGETPVEASTTGVAEIIIRTRYKVTLKCLSARAIRRHNLSYAGQIPTVLEEFVARH